MPALCVNCIPSHQGAGEGESDKGSQMTRSISWGRFEGVPMVSMNRSRPFNPASPRIRFLRATLMASAPSRGLPADPRMLSGTDVLPAHALPAQALPAQALPVFNLKLKSSSR